MPFTKTAMSLSIAAVIVSGAVHPAGSENVFRSVMSVPTTHDGFSVKPGSLLIAHTVPP